MIGLPNIPHQRQTSHSSLLFFLEFYSHTRAMKYTNVRVRRFDIIAGKLEIIIASQLFVRAVKHGWHYCRH